MLIIAATVQGLLGATRTRSDTAVFDQKIRHPDNIIYLGRKLVPILI